MGGAHAHELPVATGSGFLERRDARAKLLVTLAIVLGAVLAPRDFRRLAALGGLAVLYASLGATPPWRVLVRAGVVLPFALLGTIFLPFYETGGLAHMLDIVARASISGVVAASLGSSTELADLVRALGALHVPRAVLLTTSFTLRYLALLRDEAARLMLARELRTFGWRPALALRSMGHSVGTLFVRTFERAERVHAAMMSRGFTGELPSVFRSTIGPLDVGMLLVTVAAVLAVDLLR